MTIKLVYYCPQCSHIKTPPTGRCCPDMQAVLVPEETAMQAKLGFAVRYLSLDEVAKASDALGEFVQGQLPKHLRIR